MLLPMAQYVDLVVPPQKITNLILRLFTFYELIIILAIHFGYIVEKSLFHLLLDKNRLSRFNKLFAAKALSEQIISL
jgi:hypothetical protein